MDFSQVKAIKIPEGDVKKIMQGETVLWNRLPAEYQAVEYVQSSGTQYIKTGYMPNQDTVVIATFAPTVADASNGSVFGARRAYGSVEYRLHLPTPYEDHNYISSFFGDQIYGYQDGNYYDWEVGGVYTAKFGKSVYIDGVLQHTFDNATFTSQYALYLFAFNTSGTASGGKNRIYSCQIFDNGTLVRDFIPCYRKSDSVIGMYDIVNDVFYTNSGTGTFTKGADA